VAGIAVEVDGSGVSVGGTAVSVGGTGVFVGGTAVAVGWTGVLVGGMAVDSGPAQAVISKTSNPVINSKIVVFLACMVKTPFRSRTFITSAMDQYHCINSVQGKCKELVADRLSATLFECKIRIELIQPAYGR